MGVLFKYNKLGTQPNLDRIIIRLRILQIVCLRGYQELATQNGIPQNVGANGLVNLPDWIFDVEQELETWEIQCLNAPLGKLNPHLCIRATWLCEGIAVLLWALQLGERPSFDEPVAPTKILNYQYNTQITPILRPIEALQEYGENLFSWQTRFRQFNAKQEHIDFVKQAQEFGLDINQLPISNNDISILGKPILEEQAIVFADNYLYVASERLHAIKWLCGLDTPLYSQGSI